MLATLLLVWFFRERMTIIFPEMQFQITVAASTVILSIVFGVVVVTLTPLLTILSMARMDIPSALRVME